MLRYVRSALLIAKERSMPRGMWPPGAVSARIGQEEAVCTHNLAVRNAQRSWYPGHVRSASITTEQRRSAAPNWLSCALSEQEGQETAFCSPSLGVTLAERARRGGVDR
jgi:hypothetical protein